MVYLLYYDPFDPFYYDSMYIGMILIFIIPLIIGIVIFVVIVRSIMNMGKSDNTVIRSNRYTQNRTTTRPSRYERPTPVSQPQERAAPPPQPATPSGFCPNCGAAVGKDDAFCISCGRYLSE